MSFELYLLFGFVSIIVLFVFLSFIGGGEFGEIELGFAVFSSILLFFGGVVISLITSPLTPANIEKEKQELLSIKMDSDSRGEFLLGSDAMYGELEYIAFKRLDDGGLKPVKYSASKCTIFEDENETPYSLKVIKQKTTGYPLNEKLESPELVNCEIHVPENTVIKKYKVR